MATRYLIASALFVASLSGSVAACTGMPFGLMGGGKSQTQSHSSETETSSHSEQVNGRDIEEPGEPPAPQHHKRVAKKDKNGDLGKTCHHNNDCAEDACFTGRGDLGYCTHVCNDFSECPFNYECKHVGNAPQMICQQEN